jgi:tetratricopeptide (TPR) repeat protein
MAMLYPCAIAGPNTFFVSFAHSQIPSHPKRPCITNLDEADRTSLRWQRLRPVLPIAKTGQEEQMKNVLKIIGLASAFAFVLATASAAQSGVGQVAFANSGSPAAQEPFLHGLALMHSFEYPAAAADFRKAEAIDPSFAMAYWGEAMTFNHPVWNQQNRTAALAALNKLDATSEARLAKAPTQREKDYLQTLDVLYGDGPKKDRDQRYADAMAKLHEKYPQDIDAAALYALALLGTQEGVRNERVYMQAAGVLMPLFYQFPHHPGIAHYLIHSCDDPIHAPIALPAARAYSEIAPDAAHAQHMTSHIFLALGMWDDVVRANEAATHVVNQQRAFSAKTSSRCGHYNYWLEYGYLEAGHIDKAKQILADCRIEASEAGMAVRARGVADPDGASLLSYIAMQSRFLVDTNQWSGDVAQLSVEVGDLPMAQFDESYERALVAAETGDLVNARRALAEMDSVLPKLPEVFNQDGTALNDPNRQVPQVERQQVQALLLAAEGKMDEAITEARKAAEAESNLPYAFGPPLPIKPSYELLAELLLKQNHPREALDASKLALLRAPNRTQSLALLERASAAANASTSADAK